MKNGVYNGLGMEAYSQIEALNFSKLKKLLDPKQCPYNVRFGRQPEPGDAMKMGTAVHAWCLERQNFGNIVYVSQNHDGRTKEGKAAKAQALIDSAGKTLIDDAQFDLVKAMAQAIQNNLDCRKLAKTKGEVEEVIVFTDEKTGMTCKCKADKRIGNIALDLKTTRAKSDDDFAEEVYNNNYHAQAAYYVAAYAAAGIKIDQFWFLAVNNDELKNVEALGMERYAGTLLVTEDWLRAGELLCRYLLDTWHGYETSNNWPKYNQNGRNLPETYRLRKQLETLTQGAM